MVAIVWKPYTLLGFAICVWCIASLNGSLAAGAGDLKESAGTAGRSSSDEDVGMIGKC
jgi:hypothetical protein